MAIGVFNPKDNANAVTARPAHVAQGAAERRWYDDASRTRAHDQDLNQLVAQFRHAMDALGIADSEGDDSILLQLLLVSQYFMSGVNGGQVAGQRNRVVNGGFDDWSLGTSFTPGTVAGVNVCDGVKAIANTSGTTTTVSRVAGDRLQYALQFGRNVGSTHASNMQISGATTTEATGVAFVSASKLGATLDITVASGLTAGQGCLLAADATADARLIFDSVL